MAKRQLLVLLKLPAENFLYSFLLHKGAKASVPTYLGNR